MGAAGAGTCATRGAGVTAFESDGGNDAIEFEPGIGNTATDAGFGKDATDGDPSDGGAAADWGGGETTTRVDGSTEPSSGSDEAVEGRFFAGPAFSVAGAGATAMLGDSSAFGGGSAGGVPATTRGNAGRAGGAGAFVGAVTGPLAAAAGDTLRKRANTSAATASAPMSAGTTAREARRGGTTETRLDEFFASRTSSAARTSSGEPKRCSGSRSRHLSTSLSKLAGTSADRLLGRGAGLRSRSNGARTENGKCPVSISNQITPKA